MTAADSLVRELMVERDAFLAFVRGRLRSSGDAEDVLQQALVKAAAHAHDLRDRAHPRPWFFRILRRTAADYEAQRALREAKLQALAAELEDAKEETPGDAGRCACSLARLEQIRAEYADILRRVDIEEQTLSEVAEALGITVNNATVRLHRARKALRDDLQAFCGTGSSRACADCCCDA